MNRLIIHDDSILDYLSYDERRILEDAETTVNVYFELAESRKKIEYYQQKEEEAKEEINRQYAETQARIGEILSSIIERHDDNLKWEDK